MKCCLCNQQIMNLADSFPIVENIRSYVLCEDCKAYLDWMRTSERKEDLDAAFAFFKPIFDNRQIPSTVKDELVRIRFCKEIAEEEKRQILEQKSNASSMMFTTGSYFDGYRVEKYIDVICEEVIFKNSFMNRLNAGFEDLGNAFSFKETEMSGSSGLIARARSYVKDKFRQKAAQMGANAVLGVEFESSIGADIVRVAIFGTAVVISPIK